MSSIASRSSAKTARIAYIITIFAIQIIRLLQVHMRVGNDSRIRQVIWCVRVRQQCVRYEDVTGFCFDLSEFCAVFDVCVDGDVGVGRVESFGVVVQCFAYT